MIDVRRASAADAATLAAHRAAVWIEVGDWTEDAMRAQRPVWTQWIGEAIVAGDLCAWIAEDDGRIAGSGTLLLQRGFPRPGNAVDREGRVHGVYVVPKLRKRGIARAIMEELLAEARALRLIRLSLHPSDEARPLYTSLGFEPRDELGLHITGT